MKLIFEFFIILILSSSVLSCGKWIGNLRRDLDDSDLAAMDNVDEDFEEPTVGGHWKERGYLSGRKTPPVVGHYDRSPASEETPEVSTSVVPTLEPEKLRKYKIKNRVTRDDFIDHSQEEGSLWASSGQTNYYFTKNKTRNPGDLISLAIEDELYKDIGIEVKRTLSPHERERELDYAQDVIRAKFMANFSQPRRDNIMTSAAAPEKVPPSSGPTASPSATPSATPSVAPTEAALAPPQGPPPVSPEELQRMIPRATLADVDIYPSLDTKVGDSMMGEIIERTPNGNYKVRTVKKIPYKKGQPRLVSVVGIVKASDVDEQTDSIKSGRLYEYRVEVGR